MNPLNSWNWALAHLEEHLDQPPDVARAAQIAGCSEYHFRRMFSYLAGLPLGEYLRRRRLAVAAARLRAGEKVIDVALALGYESPDAFARAFREMHGVTPSQGKREDVSLRAFPPLTFQLHVGGGDPMDYRIVTKEAFRIVGFCKRVTLQFEGINPQIEELARRLTPEIVAQLKALCDTEPRGMLNVSAQFEERTGEGSELDQYLGVATTRPAPDGYDCLEVAAAQWAVFSVLGPFPEALQSTWARIYAEWFPGSGYQLTEGPEMLWNESPDTSNPLYKSEIWVPVVPLAKV